MALRGAAGSVLVVDRIAGSCADRRLLAHLASDEPAENATIVCADYLHRLRAGSCRCRALTLADFRCSPEVDAVQRVSDWESGDRTDSAQVLHDRLGRSYRLRAARSGGSPAQLRWCREQQLAGDAPAPSLHAREHVSLREAIASLEDYEPIRTVTQQAVALAERDNTISTTVLRAELARVQRSPIILNRALREAVLRAVARSELSMSEIAIRCGRVKRDCHGNQSGETSWLARRLGLLPEGGHSTPTPWVHSDVLALIARRGLGLAPREVEV